MENNNDKAAFPNVLYSLYFRAARGIYNSWIHEGTGRMKFSIKTYERLKGVESVLAFSLRECDRSEFDKLNEDYKAIRAWILEVVKCSDLKGYPVSRIDRVALHQDQQASELVPVGSVSHE
jgi:hypothetical protein